MERKSKGINPDNQFQAIPWLQKAAKEYKPNSGLIDTQTSFFRGNATIKILDRILPDIDHRPNILLIGLGLEFEPLVCTYEPFRVAAHLEGQGVDYTMTLVDAFKDVIEDVQNRERLFLSYRHFDKRLAEKLEVVWNEYLADTKQDGRKIFEREEGLIFSPYYEQENTETHASNYLELGIAAADVSQQFRKKLTDGEVTLVQEDIAVANIRPTGPYDYVELTNVLYLMKPEGQQLAMANISASMAKGSRLLVSDIGGYFGVPVFSQLKGWLNEEKMLQLGLGVEEVISEKELSRIVLLQKM